MQLAHAGGRADVSLSPLDVDRLDQAVELAWQAVGRSEPNPRVGCVIGLADGTVLGQGSTQVAGGPHAEVMALRDAEQAGATLRGSTAWVSLEPCSHHGRTPPCCDALLAAGVVRVVAAVEDPNPQVAGRGLERLRAAGIQVELGAPRHAQASRELNIGFFSRHERGRPWLRLKTAATLDGRTALDNGVSQWITGPEARADVHLWRKRAGAVLTGIGTAVADDPRLDVRLVPTDVQPLRVVVDSQLRLPRSARLLAPPGAVMVATLDASGPGAEALRATGAEVCAFGAVDGRVDLAALVDELGRRGVNEIHAEAGATLTGALLRTGLVDELLVYMAPMLFGTGRGITEGSALQRIDDAPRFVFAAASIVGDDLRMLLRPATGPRGLPLRRKH